MGNFVKRLISALILLPPVIFLVYKGAIYLELLVGVVVLLCAIEYYKMLGFERFDFILAIIFTLVVYGVLCHPNENALFLITLILMAAALYTLFSIKDIKGASAKLGYLFAGMMYIGLFPSFIPLIRNYDRENGFYYLFTFLAVIWLSDTFAYFIGKSIGRHKLYEMISPRKTIEGSIGGVVGGIIGVYIIALFFKKSPSIDFVLLVGVLVNLIGQAGDLFESMFKRDRGVKDSGDLIPGHGGMLDRVDAIIFSAPVMYLLLRFIL
ncbi:MAG: phosphatidate cytidylyltransferase [Myxococcota bacterium]